MPLVYADKERTAEVIENLLSSAVKHNKKGRKVTILARKESGHVRVEIENTDFGVTPNDLPHLLEEIYGVDRVNAQTSETGLELALAKSLVEMQGGRLSVEKSKSEGNKFSFTVPAGGR